MANEFDVEGQPNGIHVEQTLAVLDRVLGDLTFAEEVAEHNKWSIPDGENFQQGVALRFLAARYQWTVSLLSTQTNTLKTQVNQLSTELDDLRWQVGGMISQVAELQMRGE